MNQNDFDMAKKWYSENNHELQIIIDILQTNKEIFSLKRQENSEERWLTYTLRISSHPVRGYTILFDYENSNNDTLFMNNNFTSILTTSNQNLSSILDSNNISISDFLKIVSFLDNKKIFIITRLIDFNYILILVDPTYGLLYNPEGELPKHPEAQEIKKITDHIYYYKQKP